MPDKTLIFIPTYNERENAPRMCMEIYNLGLNAIHVGDREVSGANAGKGALDIAGMGDHSTWVAPGEAILVRQRHRVAAHPAILVGRIRIGRDARREVALKADVEGRQDRRYIAYVHGSVSLQELSTFGSNFG